MTPSIKARVPGYIIEQTARRLKRSFQQTLSAVDAGITADQWVLLDLVQRTPGLSQNEIADATAKDRPTVTRIIDRLEEKQLVRRQADDDDRRKFGIYATKDGTKLVGRLLPMVKEFRLAHFDGLDDQDMHNFLRIMDKINDNISASQNHNHALL